MRCRSVRLLFVAMLATQHTDFESFANALGALPNQPPVPMACEPSPSPIDVDTKAIVQQVVNVLLKHSPSPAVPLEVLGRRGLALARNESVTNLTSTLFPARQRTGTIFVRGAPWARTLCSHGFCLSATCLTAIFVVNVHA